MTASSQLPALQPEFVLRLPLSDVYRRRRKRVSNEKVQRPGAKYRASLQPDLLGFEQVRVDGNAHQRGVDTGRGGRGSKNRANVDETGLGRGAEVVHGDRQRQAMLQHGDRLLLYSLHRGYASESFERV